MFALLHWQTIAKAKAIKKKDKFYLFGVNFFD
jgi:hypothetical protein